MCRKIVLVFAVALWLFASRNASAALLFVDATTESGLACNHPPTQYGQWGGLAVADFNNDGFLDVFVLCAGERLFINDGAGHFTDQAAAFGLNSVYIGIGASAADYNNDGWIDIYVTSAGPVGAMNPVGQHKLYRNNGGTSFTDVAPAAGVNYSSYQETGGQGSSWGDYDLDGDLDLCVVQWTGDSFSTEHNRLYRNNNNGTFTDVSIAAIGSTKTVWGFQPAFADMNGDRYPELLIAADFETSRYFVNNGNGTFTNQTVAAGVGLDDNGMGQTVGDLNNDLLPDWYVTSIHYGFPVANNNPGNMLYINLGNHSFNEVSVAAGCNDGGWGWGTIAADLDQDGWQDIIEVNGRAGPGVWNNEQAYVFRNTTSVIGAQPTFQDVAVACGLVHNANQTSILAFDGDGDGDLDVLSYANGSTMRYFKNTTINPGSWLQIKIDTSNNPLLAPNGFGTRIEVTADGMTQMRYVDGRPSYLATSGTTAHFGLGAAAIVDTVRVKWARGYDSVYTNVPVNQVLMIQSPKPGDLNGDGPVNVFDLFKLLSDWGPCGAAPALCPSDVNNDGAVNVFDLFILLGNWG